MKLKKRDVVFSLIRANDSDRTIEGVFSTSDSDRSGDPPIDQESWNLKNFKKNPVILFAHDSHQIPVGKAVKIGLNDKGNLAGKIKFAIDEGVGVYGDLIKTIYNLYKGKFMSAFSVGFMMGEIVVDKKKKTKMVNNELLEISCVPVPANAFALAKEKGVDLSALDELDIMEEEIEEEDPEEEEVEEQEEDEETEEEKAKKEKFECECIDCGHKLKSEKHCKDIKCSECGGEMRRVERPGPGRSVDGESEEQLEFKLKINQDTKEVIVCNADDVEVGKVLLDEELKKLLFNSKKAVTECPEGRKGKSSKKQRKKLINKYVRILLKEKKKD